MGNLLMDFGAGGQLRIDYNDANQRINQVHFDIPAGVEATAVITNNDVEVYNRTEFGPIVDSENVPGNHTMELEEDPNNPGEFYYAFPSYLGFSFSMRTF